MIPRKKKNSSKVNLTISVIFHAVVVVLAFVLAAKTGLIPKKYIPIALIKPPEEKQPEKPKPPEPEVKPPKPEEAPKVSVPEPKVASAPPPSAAPTAPAAAPAQSIRAAFDFSGGKAVSDMSSDPRSMYKALVEHTLRLHWNRPEDMADDKFVAEVELTIDAKGNIQNTRWISGSGNARWDNSVKEALAEVKSVNKVRPANFPEKFVTRFDVQSIQDMQLSSR
jgi:outer membrane biosynthesis protein TonB